MDPNECTTKLFDQNFGMCIRPEDMILPFYNFPGSNYYRPWKLFTEVKKEFGSSTINNTEDKMKITLDVQHFRPNEITVKVNDREIFIEGKHEERQDDHGFISRQFMRRYVLPKDCQSETVSSTLSSDGVLTVTANRNLSMNFNANERLVPITMSGPCLQHIHETKDEQCAKKEKSSVMLETTKQVMEDAKTPCSKKDSQMMLKEDHCRLLKSDLLGEAVSGTEKLLSESRKETEELLKLISSSTSANATSAATGKLKAVLGECKSAIEEITEKASEMNIGSASMSSSNNTMISETFESQETSSSISKSSMSMQSSMTATSETVREVICAELKEAAENV